MVRKRDRLRIIYDILKAINDKNDRILHTHILYKANLSYPILEQYLQQLLYNELIKESSLNSKRVYGLTDKGFEYLRKYDVVNDFNRVFGLDSESAEEGAHA